MHKLATVFYVLWGLLHLRAAVMVYALGQSAGVGMVQGRLFQDAGFLAFFGLVAITVAAFMTWRNSVTGYWINLVSVTAVDVFFVLFLIYPGHVPLWPGLSGPLFWILAVACSSMALRYNNKTA